MVPTENSAYLRLTPQTGNYVVICRQIVRNLDFSSNKALVVLFKFGDQISVVDGDAKRSLQTVCPQIAESIDLLQARAV